jgi:osmoprotectant transport system substrate-binding protein
VLNHVRRPRVLRAAAACLVLAAVASACGSDETTATTVTLPQTVIVTHVAGDDTSQLMAALYAQALENAGLRVVRKDPIGDRSAYWDATQQGSVQVVPEKTGDLLAYLHSIGATPQSTTTTVAPATSALDTTTIPGASAPETVPVDTEATTTTTLPTNPRTVDDQVAVINSLLPQTLVVSSAGTGEVKQVIACSQKAEEAHTMGTLTDLGEIADQIVLGGPAGFETSTPLGLGTLADSYHAANFKQFVPLTDDQISDAVKNGTVDCVVTSSDNPAIGAQTMTVLLDDKALVDPNAPVALVNRDAGTPTVLQALDSVSSKLTQEQLNSLIDQMKNKGQSPDYLASVFLSTS